MKRSKLVILLLVCSLFACQSERRRKQVTENKQTVVYHDLEDIKERGKLVVLTENSSISYYLYRGKPMGFDHDMLSAFAKSLQVDLELVVIDDLNTMFDMLNAGEGDLIACNLTRTEDREEIVSFSSPLMQTRQVLVQRKPDDWKKLSEEHRDSAMVMRLSSLLNAEIYVHDYSSFRENLNKLDTFPQPLNVISASGQLDSEKLIRLVADGSIQATVADENMAQLNQTYFPEIDVSVPLSDVEDICWATRKSSTELLQALNSWIEKPAIRRKITYAYKKYFLAKKDQASRVKSDYASMSEDGRISAYDETIQRESARIDWDWRLVAALIYKESRFNPEAKSWAGAFGLMQMMPNTASRFGIDSTQTEQANIRAGVSYLRYLDEFWKDRIPDQEERAKFVLASYNIGPGHVLDAQKIARHLNKDSMVWDGAVADCLLLKSRKEYLKLEGVTHGYCRGEEAYDYVNGVLEQYKHYQLLNL